MPEYNEVLVAGSIYEGSTKKTPEYVSKMVLYVTNIDKYDKNTWRNIYQDIGVPYFG